MSTLGIQRVTDLEGTIPTAGGYVFTGHLDRGPAPAPGPTVLTLGDLRLIGSVLPSRGGLDSPDRPAFAFAGGAGWRNLLPGPGGSYASPTAVRLSTVLAALAAVSGEAYDAPPDTSLGMGYGWDAGTPCDAVLADLVARKAVPTWRVDPATGHTRFDPWPSIGAADSYGQIEDRRLARGARDVALTTRVAAFVPGATLHGALIERVVLIERGDELRAHVYDASDLTPLQRWRRIVLKLFPFLARFGIDPATGNLAVRAGDTRIDLAGGGPPVARATDLAFRIWPVIGSSGINSLWLSASVAAPYVWLEVPVAIAPPTPTDGGTPVYIAAGSSKVTSG